MNERAISTNARITHARTSTPRTKQAVSFIRANSKASAEAQRDLCSKHAAKMGLHIVHEFLLIGVDPNHMTMFDALIGLFYYLSRNPQVSHLVTANRSRLTLRSDVFAMIASKLAELEVELTTPADTLSSSSADQANKEA